MKTSYFWPAMLVLGFVLCGQSPQHPLAETTAGPHAEAAGWCDKSDQFSGTGAYDSALVYAQKAAGLAEKAKDWPTWGRAQNNILGACYGLGQFAKTAATFSTLEQKARTVLPDDDTFWGGYYNAAGAIYNMLGNYEAALKYGLQEIVFFEKTDKRTDLAIASNNVGAYYRGRGDFDRALEYTQSALRHFLFVPETDPADLAWTYGNLSKIWYRKKDYPQAAAFAEKALGILEKHSPGDHLLMIQTYVDLANACIEVKSYKKAEDYLKKALRIHADNKLDEQIEFTWYDMGYLYEMMERYPEATEYMRRSVGRLTPRHLLFGKACRHMALLSQHQGDLHGALNWQQQALRAVTDSFPYRDVLANPAVQRVSAYTDFLFCLSEKAETLQLLARKESSPAYLEASLATLDVAAGVLDSMRAEYQEGSQQFWNQEARPIMERAIELAIQMHQNTGKTHYLEQAFRYAEKSKAQLLAEALRESADKQRAGIPDTLLQKEKQLKIDIAFYKKQIFQEQQKSNFDTAGVLLWQNEILQRRRAYEDLLSKLESGYPEYYQTKYRHPALTVAGAQAALPAETGLLEYFQGDRGTYVFYFDRSRAVGLRLPADSSFSVALNHLLDGLRDRDRVAEQGLSAAAIAGFANDAAAVYRTLIAPAVEKIPKKLLVIPDGRLSYLPFELLLTQNPETSNALNYSTLPYLLRQTTLRYEYSAGLALQSPARRLPSRFFAGYAPVYGGEWSEAATRGGKGNCRSADANDFAPLRNNRTEVTQIAQMLDGQSFVAENATEAKFRQHLHEPRILHLAMHGFLNDCDPLYSGLVFSRQAGSGEKDSPAEDSDGFLHAYEIYNLHLNAELAVLSACNTGRGQLAKGEGVISLARAFKYAGCANVLMSLWQADDQATAEVMQNFYRHLQKGLGKDAAIRQAKLDYLESNNRNHPFFWGAFVLIGDDLPLKQSSGWGWYALGLLLAGLAVAAFLVARRRAQRKNV